MIRRIYTKYSIFYILLSFLIVSSASAASKTKFEVNGLYYNILSSTTCEVTNMKGGSSLANVAITSSLAEGEKKKLVIPSKVEYDGQTYTVIKIGQCAFQYLGDFTEVEMPSTITAIDFYAFQYNQTLESIEIGDSVQTISASAFAYCKRLKSIKISKSVYSISSSAFYDCPNIESIAVDSENKYYDSRDNCNAIIDPYNDNNILIVGCKNSTIPEGVKQIGENAFYACSGLTSVLFPSTLTTIGESAFSGCTGLSSIFISAGLAEIGENAFEGCPNVKSIKVDDANKNYDSRNDCNALIETSSNTLIMGCGSTVIPNGVVAIGQSAFAGCKVLDSISLPNGVKTVGYSAFYNSSIKTFDGGNSLTTISGYAFGFCSNLTNVTLPSTLTTIDDRAFYDCKSLTSIINYATTPQVLSDNTFGTIPDGATLHVCNDCTSKYEAFKIWKDFNIVEDLESSDLFINDAEPYTGTETKRGLTIRYVRNYTHTRWQALYIPFSLDYESWSKNFDVAYINNFHNYDTDDDGLYDYVQLEVCKITSGKLVPNTPYLIRAKETGEQILTASNATLYPAVANSLDCSTVTHKFIFTGTYTTIDNLNSKGYYFMSGGDLCNTTNSIYILSPYRWYMQIEEKASRYSETSFAKAIRFGFSLPDENETTGIEIIPNKSKSEKLVSDLYGRMIERTDIHKLPKGIYIINNHKYINR